MLMTKIYAVNSDMINVIGMSDLNIMLKGPELVMGPSPGLALARTGPVFFF